MVKYCEYDSSNNEIRKILKEASVGIAGLGGLGSNAAVSLVRSGIGKLVLIDFDKIEEDNLNRQYYFKDQIGKLKTDAIKENIDRITDDVIIELHNTKLNYGNAHKYFKDVDVIIEALDDAKTKYMLVEEIQKNLNIPLIVASGVAGFGSTKNIEVRESKDLYIVENRYAPSSCKSGVLIATRVCFIANLQANLAIEIIMRKSGVNKRK